MKRLILMLILSGLGMTSAGCGAYKPNVGYELVIETEGDVGSITLYLPVLTYKKKPVEEVLKSLLQRKWERAGKKEKILKELKEYEAKYEEAKKKKEEAEKSLKEAEAIYNETKKRVEGAEEKMDAKIYYERAVREGRIARDPEYEKKIKGPEPQDWENYHNSQIDLLGKQNNYSYWNMEMEKYQEYREDTKKHYEWIKGVNLEFIETRYGKMLKVFIPDRGYNKWYYDFEGGGDLPYAAKSCKERTARDEFRISPMLGEEKIEKTFATKWDTITAKKVYTPIYAEFERGTVTISLEFGMFAQWGELRGGWIGENIEPFGEQIRYYLGRDGEEVVNYYSRLKKADYITEEDGVDPTLLSRWAKEARESLILTKPGWHIIPAIREIEFYKFTARR